MQRFIKRSLIAIAIILSLANFVLAGSEPQLIEAPLSKEFLEWRESLNKDKVSTKQDKFPNGYVPFPVDLSYLADNPPREDSDGKVKTLSIPETYDLRSVSGKSYVTSVKNQGDYGTCWAHAAIGAMESNYLVNGGSTLDLSEMHLAWYTFKNSDKTQALYNMTSSNYDSVMNHGGNVLYPAAIYTRLSGPVLESEVPYPTQPSGSTPEDYTRVLRLRDIYFLSKLETTNINDSSTQRDIVKQRIIKNGSVVVSYESSSNYYRNSSGETTFYTTGQSTNHAVQIIGWDDNYSASNFKTNPGMNGAWLIKNSWGTSWGDSGYFWMSYKQYLTGGAAFVVEDKDSNMNVYYYDALGWCSASGWPGSEASYSANVFKSTRDEYLTEIGFFAPNNNMEYEIIIYDNLGTSMPSSSPVGSSAALTQSGTIGYAGYHTVDLSSAVQLTSGKYFSVIVKMYGITYIPIETKISGYSDNAKIETGSFFSYNGTTWTTGANFGASNACIKAFTVISNTVKAPSITTSYLPDGLLNKSYSQTLTASGGAITWSKTSGNLPDGLELDSTGTISGTPTTAGDFEFTVKATNSAGSDSAAFTITINEQSTFNKTSFSGYVGSAFTETLSLSGGESAAWKANDTMPSGLKLAPKTGVITGKPTKQGTFTISFTATTSDSDEITEDVTFTINAKLVKPTISTSSLKNGTVGVEYEASLTVKGTDPVSITSEGIPDGLTIDGTYIHGTPTTAGTYTIKISAANTATELAGGTPVTKNIKLVIKDHAPVIIISQDLPEGKVGESYTSDSFTTSAGDNITWSASGLPAGLKINASTGVISGKPTRAGNFNVTIRAKNSGGNDSVKLPLSILQTPSLTTTKIKDAKAGSNYNVTLKAAGTTPIKWEVTGLPDALELTANESKGTATISGIPAKIGTYTISITLTCTSDETLTAAKTITLKVTGDAPRISGTLKRAAVDEEYSDGEITAKGTMPINLSYMIMAADKTRFGIDSLEDLGLTFTASADSGTATITGTPTKSVKALPIYIIASNDVGQTSKKFNFTAAGEKPVFTTPESTTTNITTSAGSEISLDFTVTGTKTITLSATSASGFTFTQTGDYTAALTGTAPSKESNTTITITAQNADGKATRKVVIKTKVPPTITTPQKLPNGKLKQAYKQKITATGSKTIKWSIEGDLPDGIKFNNGNFSGKPTESGDFVITIIASNDVGKVSKEYTLTIIDPNAPKTQTQEISSESQENLQVQEIESAPESKSESESEPESTQETQESAITYGESQTLSAEAIKNFTDKGFIVIAELPEIQVTKSGQYDIDLIIELDEGVKTGRKLYYFAIPNITHSDSEDDEIVEFYDESGQEILTVPESHKIKISAWLTEGVIYRPVICVEAESETK
ncbi:MAG: putative Ig domain-containing protein [Synergistaceae bacterium]|nr:putative Ig domain-containing protein [Synergistaceae bacterium]